MLCLVFSVITNFCIRSFFDHIIHGIKLLAINLQTKSKENYYLQQATINSTGVIAINSTGVIAYNLYQVAIHGWDPR